jgi:hypothetical protein
MLRALAMLLCGIIPLFAMAHAATAETNRLRAEIIPIFRNSLLIEQISIMDFAPNKKPQFVIHDGLMFLGGQRMALMGARTNCATGCNYESAPKSFPEFRGSPGISSHSAAPDSRTFPAVQCQTS